MNERLMLRPAECAEAIGISRSKAYELISSGAIPSVTVGGCIRVPVEQLRTWIAAQTTGGSQRPEGAQVA